MKGRECKNEGKFLTQLFLQIILMLERLTKNILYTHIQAYQYYMVSTHVLQLTVSSISTVNQIWVLLLKLLFFGFQSVYTTHLHLPT